MEKIYTFENARVHITEPNDKQRLRIQKATQTFLMKVIEEEIKHGNYNKTGTIRKK